MIFNTTYINQEYDEESDLLVGKKFTLFERMKLGGIGYGYLKHLGLMNFKNNFQFSLFTGDSGLFIF